MTRARSAGAHEGRQSDTPEPPPDSPERANIGELERLRAENARLRQDTEARRLAEENARMRRVLEGTEPLSADAHEGRSFIATPAIRIPTFRPASPPTFSASSVKELTDYEDGWAVYLEAIQTREDSDMILQAASSLKGHAREAWLRIPRDERPQIWASYVECLRRMVVDPASRISYATLQKKEAQQKNSQSVRDFLKYLETLERDIPEMDRETRLAWDLLNGLRTELRIEILKENENITSRAQVIAAAQRQEELENQRKRVAGRTHEKHGSSSRRSPPAPKRTDQPKRQPEARGMKRKGTCHYCGKENHYESECRKKAADLASSGNQAVPTAPLPPQRAAYHHHSKNQQPNAGKP